jgi:DNA-binding response OmpR family regulator
MLEGARILVAEDEMLIAADLADHLEGFGATVVGPASTLSEGMRLASTEQFDTALLDFNLFDGDVTPLLDLLAARGVAVVVYTGRGVPRELIARHSRLTVVPKPTPMHRILEELAAARERLDTAGPPPGPALHRPPPSA